MFELFNLLVLVAAIVGVALAIGTRDKIRTIEFRLTLIDKRLRELADGVPQQQQPETEPPPIPVAIATPAAPPQPAPAQEAAVEQPPAPPVPPPSPPSVPPTPPPAAPEPTRSFEERFGTQWVIWGAGIAITMGGFLFLRYSIEAGWFGPGTRVLLAAVLALVLIAVGDWSRRNEKLSGITGIPSAHIPSILTAAGTAIAYADVWAAHALYGFIGPATAFVLLGLVALATLAAALLHGPWLAGLGLIGAYVTPILVSSDRPNYWALYGFLAIVTAAAFALARARLWRWLAITAVAFGLFWTFPGITDYRVDWLTPHNFHVVAGFVLVAIFIVSGLFFGPDARAGEVDPVSSGALAAYLLGSAVVLVASDHDPIAFATYVVLVGATLAIAWRAEAATGAVPAAALLTMLVFAAWAARFNLTSLIGPGDPFNSTSRLDATWHIALGILFSAMFGVSGYLAQGRSERAEVPMLWSASAVFAPLAILIALYFRIAGFDRSIPFAATALLLAVLFAFATEGLGRRETRAGIGAAGAIFATGAVAALALALTMSLEKGWLTVALALMVPGVAFVSDKRPLPALRTLTGIIVLLVLARIAWDPRIVGSNVGTTPIFNWLLYGYGVPAVAFWLGGYLLRRRGDDAPARLCDSAALLFGVLVVFLEIRHYITGGDIYRVSSTLTEIALDVSAGLAITIGLEWLRHRTKSLIHDVGALIMAALTLAAIVVGLGLIGNPLIWPYRVGGSFFNLVLLGYGLPAVLAVVLALASRGVRPRAYSMCAAVIAVALALAYLTIEVRVLYHGEQPALGSMSDAEQYTYSAVWLAFGVVLLAVGYFLQATSVRIASASVVILTVFKVFLIDMRDLTGIWKPLSLLGLGVVLLGIGWFYQRLLFPRPMPPQPPPATT